MKPQPADKRCALFSDCRAYRYTLSITWDETLPKCNFIGLNPSTADEYQDDPTIRRCKAFAKSFGAGGLIMTNLFAYRATIPKDMKRYARPIGEAGHYITACNVEFLNRNDFHLYVSYLSCLLRVAAWGNDGEFLQRSKAVCSFLTRLDCLGQTKSGQPKHPLYLSRSSRLFNLSA